MADRLVALRPFADDGDAAGVVRASVRRAGHRLVLRYVLAGPAARAVLPPAAEPERRDELWRHTCFEAFLAPHGGEPYWELNVSPSGDWNVYRFDGYRAGMRPEPRAAAPAVKRHRARCGTLTVEAAFDMGGMAELAHGALDVALAAVLEAAEGTLSYWSVVHPADGPDFHRRDGFVVRLGAAA